MICAMFVGVLDIVITAAVQAIKIQTRASFVRELENVLIVREQVESGSTSTELILVLGFLH